MKKERSVSLRAYLRAMHAYARGASHNATTCGLVKCGFGRLKARVIFGDTSYETLVWVRPVVERMLVLGKENIWALTNNLKGNLKNFDVC